MANIFYLSESQEILFYSAMIAVLTQLLCIYCLQKGNNLDMHKCFGYIFFTAISYLYYYKLAIE
jgi:hypothetical protein